MSRHGNLPFVGNILMCLRSLEFRIFTEILGFGIFVEFISDFFFCHTSVLSRYLAYLMFPTLFHQCGSISIMHQHHALWNRKTIKLSID